MMKTIHLTLISIVIFLFLVIPGYSQSQNENYVMTTTYKDDTGNPGNAFINITYFDGLGRPIQQIAHAQSGSGADLITHIEYDGFGRQTKEFLPYERTMASLDMDSSAETNLYSFYSNPLYGNTAYPYSEKEIENTVLGRIMRQAAPGEAWAMDNSNNSEIAFEYRTNTANEVYYFKVDNPDGLNPILILNSANNGKYPANQLYKNVVKDENHPKTSGLRGLVIEYKDKQGRVILKRHYGSESGYRSEDPDQTIAYDTYYVYDSYGNLPLCCLLCSQSKSSVAAAWLAITTT